VFYPTLSLKLKLLMLTKGLALNKQEKLEIHQIERKAVDLEHHKSLFSE
jgi:hypothetical protein